MPQLLSNSSGGPTELINQVAPLHNSGLVPSTASVPLPPYAACIHSFIHCIQHLLTYVVDMSYITNNWSVKEFKDEIEKLINGARRKSAITSQAPIAYQRPLAVQ